MEHFVTKEQVIHILKNHGHNVVGDSAFTTGSPISEIEAIVNVCDVIAQVAYDQGVKDATERHIDLQNQMAERVSELTEFNQELRIENKQLCETVEDLRNANRGLADSVVKKPIPDNEVGQVIKAMRHMQMNPTSVVAQNIEEYSKRAADLMEKFMPSEPNEAQELEQAIETIQITLSGSFRDNLKLEVTEQHAWLVYGNLKFLVEPMEAWQAVQSCVYLSGLEVDNDNI
jgi:phosphopantetheine adenylyltransferase